MCKTDKTNPGLQDAINNLLSTMLHTRELSTVLSDYCEELLLHTEGNMTISGSSLVGVIQHMQDNLATSRIALEKTLESGGAA